MATPIIVQEARAEGLSPYRQLIQAGAHQWLADLPASGGGQDLGPAPMELLAASLGSCTTMTLRMYADLKQLPLEQVCVELEHEKVEIDGQRQDLIRRRIQLQGPLTPAQRQRLLEIAGRCPVARTLSQGARLEDRLEP